MKKEINHSGYINISREYECVKRKTKPTNEKGMEKPTLKLSRHYAYDFNNGDLVIHAFEKIPEINGNQIILGYSYDNKPYLFCSQLPVDMPDSMLYPMNYHQKIDYVIKDYQIDSKYTEAVFDFDELQYFCPSESVVSDDENKVWFSRERKEVKEFTIDVDGVTCEVNFVISSKGSWGYAHSNMEAVTEIHITFPETNNLVFLSKLYLVVDFAFAFICNRRNTTCLSMRLVGKYPSKTIKEGKIVDCIKPCQSEMYFFNSYREEPEGQKIISDTWYVSGFLVHIDKLFQMIAGDISDSIEDGGAISISSLHPSIKRRNLIDLQQSLQITGAFEFYVRKYILNEQKEKNYHTVLRMVLEDLAKKTKGKLKEHAKRMSKHVLEEPALEDKVLKVYKGCGKWKTINNCLDAEWFKEEDIKKLGHEANLWRNELAHSKRSYEPNEITIKAIRLIEHMNYAIVLRQLGFEDDEIKDLLSNALVR